MENRLFLIVCETFYSIQGEGLTAGTPSVFLRLSGCNLRCQGFTYQDPNTKEHLGCDSKRMWLTGQRKDFSAIVTHWQQQGWLDKLQHGAHLVITGGEPILQQKALIEFIRYLDTILQQEIYIEIETNGTLLVDTALLQRINQFNVSPKLSNSGEKKSKALNPEALKALFNTHKALLKFVIAEPSDIEEIFSDYLIPFKFERRKIWLMPEGGTPEKINAKKAWLVELCKQHLFNFTTRLQIDIWQEVVGV